MPLKWNDAEGIALHLQEDDPELDPMSVHLGELRDRVLALEEFEDDPEQGSEKILQAIQEVWSEAFQDE